MVRSIFTFRDLEEEGPSKLSPVEIIIYYKAGTSKRIYDGRKTAPRKCYNCSEKHFRFLCPWAVGSDEEMEFRSTQKRLTEEGPVIPLGFGFFMCANQDAAQAWMTAQHGQVANEDEPIRPEWYEWVNSLQQATPSGDDVVDNLATLFGDLNVG